MEQPCGGKGEESAEQREQTFDLEASFRHATEESPLPVVFTRGDAHIAHHGNPAFYRLLGASCAELMGKPLVTLFEETLPFKDLLDRVYRSGVTDFANHLTCAGAQHRTVHCTAIVCPLLAEHAHRRGLLVRLIDTTEQTVARLLEAQRAEEVKQANEALLIAGLREQALAERATRQKEEVNALLENMTEGVTVIDGDGHVVLMNPVGRKMLGSSSEIWTIEEYRRCDFRRSDDTLIPFDQGALSRALRGEHFSDEEMILLLSDGSRRHLLFSGSALRDSKGAVTLAINVFRDVSKLRELEATREEYVSLVSHDLRGPLSAARMSAELLRRHPERLDQRRELADKIVRNIDRTDRMVRDLLDAQMIRAGKRLLLKLERCDLAAVARDVAEELITMFGDRFLLDLDEDVRGFWSDDELRRALWNLGNNAVKHGAPDTPIIITARRLPGRVRLSVHNEGPPIPAEDQALLFKPFSRGRAAGSRGWGLGLTLVLGCAEAHGGRVWVDGEGGGGTTFTIELPLDARPYQT